jgi:hypothetical protein
MNTFFLRKRKKPFCFDALIEKEAQTSQHCIIQLNPLDLSSGGIKARLSIAPAKAQD